MGLSSTSTSHLSHYSEKLKMMDLISDELVLKGHTSQIYHCAWNPSAPILVSVSGDLRFWNISDGTDESRPQCDPIKVTECLTGQNNVSVLEWNDAGTLLATASYNGQTRIWSTSGELKSTLNGDSRLLFALKWNKNNASLLTGASDGTAVVWDVNTSKVKQQFDITLGKYSVVDVDWRDDDSFATCSESSSICIYKIGETHPIRTFGNENQAYANCVRWDPTGLLLASCSNDHTIKIWRVEEDLYVRNFEEHNDEVELIRWRPGTNQPSMLASGSQDNTVKLWDVEQGKSLYTLHEHWAYVRNLAFSPNGEYLASGARDEIHIWSVKEGKLIKSYLSEVDGVTGVCWNNEGNKIAAGFADGTVRVLNFRK